MPDYILEAEGIVKRYGGQAVLDNVTFRAVRGAVNVLIGENGAGKSTLMGVLAGTVVADAGTLHLRGRDIVLRSPRDATQRGIGIVHQELALMPNLDVTENVFAGWELVRRAGMTALRWIDRAAEDRHTAQALSRLHQSLAIDTPVEELTLGQRQIVELTRALARGAEILILDEPTSALSVRETEALFAVLAELKRQGVTIIYISHRLHELLHLGDYFTVLRGGRVAGTATRADVDRSWIVERISGSAMHQEADTAERQHHREPLLEAQVDRIRLSVSRGEILGVYGLLGSGRTELMQALAGARPFRGRMSLEGETVRVDTVAEAIAAGIVLVPEDRQRDGLVPELSVRENVMLGAKGALLSPAEETQRVRAVAKELNLSAPDLEAPVATLSGGNQQKVLLARCLLRRPKVLLLDEPTRGVDVGAKTEIYAILKRLAAEGLAVVFTSSEIEEMRALADRALVMRESMIAAEFSREELTDEALFAAASPVVREAVAA